MIDIAAVCRLVGGIEVTELERWIVARWVLPERDGSAYVFHEVDVARVRLIVEMKQDMALDEEAIPLVLRLLDQVYALRRRLRTVRTAIDALPPEHRAAVIAHLESED
jgi:chaperone modulatory protein CbpM